MNPTDNNDEQAQSDSLQRIPPQPGQTGSQHTTTWTEHEHQADRAKLQAQKLVDEAGSKELAKQALDGLEGSRLAGDGHKSAASPDQESFARRLGFESYAALQASSTAVYSDDGHERMIGASPSGKWIIWIPGNWSWHQQFNSWQEVRDVLAERRERP